MSMREEVLKLAKECGATEMRPYDYGADPDRFVFMFEDVDRFYQAAYLAGAKAMQEEAERKCDQYKRGVLDLVNVRELQYAIREIVVG